MCHLNRDGDEEVSDVDACLEEEYSSDRNVHVKRFSEGSVDGIFKEQWGKQSGINKQGEMRLEKGPGQTYNATSATVKKKQQKTAYLTASEMWSP